MVNKLIVLLITTLTVFFASAETNLDKKTIAQEKLKNVMEFYLEEAARLEKTDDDLNKLILEIEKELNGLSIAKQEIEKSKNIITNLYVDLKDTKNLHLLDFDKDGNIKAEIKETADIITSRLGSDSKVVKVKLSNGQMLPLIKYKIQKDDTLKKILLKTYPKNYKPSWSKISNRIKTLVKINKSIIKMNYIYPDQIIYIPLFKDNPSKEEVKENILNQNKKKINKL